MKYDVKIHKDKPFNETLNGKTTHRNGSVEIKFLDDDGSVTTQKYGYITADEIIQDVKTGKDIILDGCYVKDLVLSKVSITSSVSCNNTFFDGGTNFKGVMFNEKADFLGTTFSGEVDFGPAEFNGDTNFSYAEFNRDTDFSCATFSGKINFVGSIFSEEVNFSSSKFKSQASFNNSIFSEKAGFNNSTFGGEVNFMEATFDREADFSASVFIVEVNFVQATFNREADFELTKFHGEAIFSDMEFRRKASFTFTTFNNQVSFGNSSIKEQIIFYNVIFSSHVDVKFKICNSLVIEDCIIEKTLDLQGAKFNSLCFENTKNLGQIFIDWERDTIKKAIYEYAKEHKLPYYTIAKQFLMLKENFNEIGQYDDEDAAYVEYKRCKAKSELHNENGDKGFKRIRSFIAHPFKWFIFDYIGSYATAPLRIFNTLWLNILGFAIIYFLGGIYSSKFQFGNGPIAKCLERFMIAIYFSAITSFTVGYGDISPQSFFIAIVAVIESFIGVFLMSYFTVAFARKILR
ncbi:potassium channel family protein [Clostridium sp. WILCCON 0269]|uniref:Potassium channel family protein n=1 Tax=Candidatus Clostridium eludens TaxID=3381663 RepID=A0ABW8SDQ4_9CLOT